MKIAIIGCGITGAYLAWKLSEKGHEVTIFEKRNTIGKIICSGLISERLWEFVPLKESLIENKIDYAIVHFHKKASTLKFKQQMHVMSHVDLDKYVAGLAQKAGTKILYNQNIEKLPEGFDRIIGTDGALSITRKLLGLKDPYFRQGLQFFVDEKNSNNFVDTWPVKCGFIWKIPRGKIVEYGIMADPKTAKKQLDEFCKQQNLEVKNLQAWLIPLGLITSNNSKVALCGGDACGNTKPWSGGGVIWSLAAANILLKHFPDFEKYNSEMDSFFGSTIWKTKLITNVGYLVGKNFPWLLPNSRKIDSDFIFDTKIEP